VNVVLLKIKRLYFFCIVFLSLAVHNAMYAQDMVPANFEKTNSSLTDNNIKNIAQDDLGYIWIATEYGLNRYDGKNINHYYAGGSPINLPGNNISYLKFFGNNQLGISTTQGFLLLNTKTFEQQIYKVADTGLISYYQNNTWDAMLLANDKIAISTCTGFYVFNKEGSLHFRYDKYKAEDINKRLNWGKEIYRLPHNQYLVMGEEDNYGWYDGSRNQFRFIQHRDSASNMFPFLADDNWRRIRLSETELLITHQYTDSIFYLNVQSGRGPTTKLPFPLLPNISWNAKARWASGSSMLLNLISGGVVQIRF